MQEYLDILMKFLCDKRKRIDYIFTVGNASADRAEKLMKAARPYMRGAVFTDDTFMSTEKLTGYISIKEIVTAGEMPDKICVLLGGRAAECHKYGIRNGINTGSGCDLSAATSCARDMVCKYGMSDETGLAVRNERELSGVLAEKVYNAVNGILEKQMKRASGLIEKHRNILDALAGELLRSDRISGPDAKKIYDSLISKAAE